MKLSEQHQFTCELYRRQLLQSGVDELVANSLVAVLAQVYWAVQQNKESRARLRERYARSLNRAIGLAFAAGLLAGIAAAYLPTLWG